MSDWFERFGYGEVADGLLTGAYPQDAEDVRALAQSGVTRVFNLVQDLEYEPGTREACAAALAEAGIEEARVEVVDYGGLSADALERAVTTILGWLQDGERVYLHCRAGWQRSSTVAAGVVALRDGVSPLHALEQIRGRRPEAEPLAHQREDLASWWAARGG